MRMTVALRPPGNTVRRTETSVNSDVYREMVGRAVEIAHFSRSAAVKRRVLSGGYRRRERFTDIVIVPF